ncbi:hypothetical protein AN958_07254 [Leucoagaricus sp. SymC.cos]|nr:hypothetical protein AN958_07254 [Leucoagaricus sp. SymC.cos]
MSVKIEFHDLDGLRWTQTALRRLQHHHRPTILAPVYPSCPLAVPLKAQTPSCDMEATIRASARRTKSNLHQLRQLYCKRESGSAAPTSSPLFWDDDSETDSPSLGFPIPPSMISPSSPSNGFPSGLGFISPIFNEQPARQLTTNQDHSSSTEADDFFHDSVLHSTPSRSHSSLWVS